MKKKQKQMGDEGVIISVGRMVTEGYYDYQMIRIGQYNRLRDIIRRKIENIPMVKPEEKKERTEYLEKFNDKQILLYLQKLEKDGKIKEHERRYLSKALEVAIQTKQTENKFKRLMKEYTEHEPLWTDWLSEIIGIDAVLAANLLKNFEYCEIKIYDDEGILVCKESDEPEQVREYLAKLPLLNANKDDDEGKWKACGYKHVSSLWRHAGFDPEGAKTREKGKSVHYNPKLKTMMWKIGTSFIKQKTPGYYQKYINEKEKMHNMRTVYVIPLSDKHRIMGDILDETIGTFARGTKIKKENYPKLVKTCKKQGIDQVKIIFSDNHIHYRALRKMIKIFMQHYWLVSRDMKGLPLGMPYAHDKLGHTSFIPPPFYKFNNEPNSN